MAELICPRKGCRANLPAGAVFCPKHFCELVEETTPETPEQALGQEGAPVEERAPIGEAAPPEVSLCWACDAPHGGPADLSCRRCARPAIPPPLYLRINTDIVELQYGHEVWLGRSESTRYHRLFHDRRVSGRHALIGLELDGSAWILDKASTNHTHVDGCRITKNVRTPLTDGQRIEFVPGVEATVYLRQP